MNAIVWTSKPLAGLIGERLSSPALTVGSAREFLDAERDSKTLSFLDTSTLDALDRLAQDAGTSADGMPTPEWRKLVASVSVGPVIVVSGEPVATTIGWLPTHPWLSHVISTALLEHPTGADHLADVLSMLSGGRDARLLDWLRSEGGGRRVRLTHASRRGERLERMGQFFASQDVGPDAVALLREATEDLLVNVFYAAPVAAGAANAPIERSRDVALPDELACDLAYGCTEEHALVRVRDPFGALSRQRLVDALARGSRGERSSGLWRVFSRATIAAVSIITNRHTEVLFAVPRRASARREAYAFHIFVKEGPRPGFWKLISDETGEPSLNASVTVTKIE